MRKKTAQSRRPASKHANRPVVPAIDPFDRKILRALVENARASNVEIAQKVGLSEAPCSRRIRRLEADEVILGYHAQLDHDAIGIGFVAFVTLVLDYVTASTAERFYQEIRAIPEIMSCYIVSGGYARSCTSPPRTAVPILKSCSIACAVFPASRTYARAS